MLDRAAIAALIPHAGTMCLLDRVRAWSPDAILAEARSHLDPANPLRRDGTLPAVCGCEYGFQAAALHGALRSGRRAGPGFLAGLRLAQLGVLRLDDPALGVLAVESRPLLDEPGGLVFAFRVASEAGATLLEGEATVVLR